jgi:hypothetical protein
MEGSDENRTIQNVRDSFIKWCVKRVAYLEKGACPGYADVVVMSLTPMVNSPSQGGTNDVCLLMNIYIGQVKAVEQDLALVEGALPKQPGAMALLSDASNFAARWHSL